MIYFLDLLKIMPFLQMLPTTHMVRMYLMLFQKFNLGLNGKQSSSNVAAGFIQTCHVRGVCYPLRITYTYSQVQWPINLVCVQVQLVLEQTQANGDQKSLVSAKAAHPLPILQHNVGFFKRWLYTSWQARSCTLLTLQF